MPSPDTSLLTTIRRDNPDFLFAALAQGAFVECALCGKIVGVGTSRDDAGMSAIKEGTAVMIDGGEFLCRTCDKAMHGSTK